jgi:predicted nucleic acid-binding protein
LYVDSSALVKLVIEEPESTALEAYLPRDAVLATSRIALVEVPRATALANPSEEVRQETARLLQACLLVAVSDRVLRDAAAITSREVRTLNAIHLATALHVEADDLIAYDRRLLTAAKAERVKVTAPGCAPASGFGSRAV